MGGKTLVIALVPKPADPNAKFKSQEASLREHGLARFPGSKVYLSPFRDTDSRYRTGLDENALYINNIPDKAMREVERKRVKELRESLEQKLNINLAPDSNFYRGISTNGSEVVGMIALGNDEEYFNLDDPFQAINAAWLRVHPKIASSLEAYNRGEYNSDTQYYVKDDEYERAIIYSKKKALNDARIKMENLSLEKRKKIASLMGLPVSESSKEDVVYNELDNVLTLTSMKTGPYADRSPIEIFNMFVELNSESLDIKFLVEEAIRNQIYRVKMGVISEGTLPIAKSKEELINHLLSEKGQEDRLILEKKLDVKKLALV